MSTALTNCHVMGKLNWKSACFDLYFFFEIFVNGFFKHSKTFIMDEVINKKVTIKKIVDPRNKLGGCQKQEEQGAGNKFTIT